MNLEPLVLSVNSFMVLLICLYALSLCAVYGAFLFKNAPLPLAALAGLYRVVQVGSGSPVAGNGFILTAMLWGAFLAELIDRRLRRAALYLGLLAVMTLIQVADRSIAWTARVPSQSRWRRPDRHLGHRRFGY